MCKHFIVIVTITLLSFAFAACNNEKPKEDLQFYYYPAKNVYYDLGNKVFFYSLDGTKTWNTFLAGNTNTAALGEKVIVYSTTTNVYKDNENHRRTYNGTLLNINTNVSAGNTMVTEVTERKIEIKKAPISKAANETKKRKKGLRKFIGKIFDKIRHFK